MMMSCVVSLYVDVFIGRSEYNVLCIAWMVDVKMPLLTFPKSLINPFCTSAYVLHMSFSHFHTPTNRYNTLGQVSN